MEPSLQRLYLWRRYPPTGDGWWQHGQYGQVPSRNRKNMIKLFTSILIYSFPTDPVCLFFGLSLYLFISLFFYLSIFLSLYLSIFLSFYFSIFISLYFSIFISLYLSISLSVDPSIYLSVCLSICPSVRRLNLNTFLLLTFYIYFRCPSSLV